MGCLADDDLLDLVRGKALGEVPSIEAHLADCALCSALLATLVTSASDDATRDDWGALVGTMLGPYRLEAQIGAGAAGAVYQAWDERLRRKVAVKVLGRDAAHGRWVETEARAAAAISHPNVVTIHDVGRAGEHAYVVSELIDGESLRSILASGAQPFERVRRLALELARGLAAAHAAGVIHRDLKPENLLVARDGSLKILDFGLAKLAGPAGGLDATIPGTVLGTVGYMAPEQARGEAVDARADLFAAGAIVYELGTGRRAFDGASHADRMGAVLRDTPAMDARLGELGPVVMRCLAKDPGERFQSAEDLAWVIASIATTAASSTTAAPSTMTSTTTSRRAVMVGGGAAITAGLLGFALGRWGRRAARAPAAPSLRQLTFRQGRLMTARFARHGAEVFFGAAWDEEPLAAHALRLDGGVARRLELPPADVLAVSSTQLAVALDRKHVDGQSATGRLALAPIDGGVPHEVRGDVQEADFSADGKELAVVVRAGHSFRLELPAGRVLLDRGWITHPRISPDGRRVACLVHPDATDDQGALAVIDRAGGAVRILSDGWSSVAGVAWSPRGDRVWVTGSRGPVDNALHELTLDGRERELFSTMGRLRLHDVAADGRVLVSRDVWRLRTMAGGGDGPDVDRSLTPLSMVTDISSDGASLLMTELGDVDDVNGVYLTPSTGGQRLRIGAGWARAWSRDGQRVFAFVFDRVATGPPQAVILSINGGERTPVTIDPVAMVTSAAWLDDQTLVLGGGDVPERGPRLWRVPVGGRGATPLTAEGDHGVFAIDAAARRVAFIDGTDRLRVLTLDGTAPRTVGTPLPDHVVCGWRGDDILVRTTFSPVTIRRIDAATGAASPHLVITPPALGLKGVDAVALSADGNHHAYSYGQELSQLFEIDLRRA